MFCLITLLVTFQWQPSLPPFSLGHNFDRLIHEWKLMQHLEICLPSDLPTTEAYFSFQLTFIIPCSPPTNKKWTTTAVEFLFLFFKTEFEFGFSWKKVSKKDSLMTAFVTVHAGSFCGLRKISSSISHLLTIRILPLPLQNVRNTAAIKILLLEDGSFIWFGLRKTSPRDSSRTCRQQSAGNVSGLTYSLSGATSEASKAE